MNKHDVEQWEQQLSSEQQDQLRELRARNCRVEAVFVSAEPASEQGGVRLSVTVDHLLLATVRMNDDIPAAFEEAYREALHKLTLPGT